MLQKQDEGGQLHGKQLGIWTQQQHEMASRVIKEDDVPWRLGGPGADGLLQRVGGLDISFTEDHAAPETCTRTSCGEADAAEGRPGGGAEGAETTAPALPALNPAVAALVVLSFPDMRLLYEDYEPVDLAIPYLPGYLGFRECAAYSRLLGRVEASPHPPQVLLVDGCGVLHPRGCGSACQVGVTCGYPSVGVAKNLLVVDGLDRFEVRRALQEAAVTASSCGGSGGGGGNSGSRGGGVSNAASGGGGGGGGSTSDRGSAGSAPSRRGHSAPTAPAAPPSPARDVQVPLVGTSGQLHGVALCPGATTKPLYISVGHRLSLDTAVELVRRCCLHRIPEPIRQADLRSRQWLRNHAARAAVAAAAAAVAAAGQPAAPTGTAVGSS